MFAQRTDWNLTPNRMSQVLTRMRKDNEEIIDLTESNPTQAGFEYPEELLRELARPESLRYEPDPRGLPEARRAVTALFAGKGASVDPDRIFLTASTSEAYSMLFRLLADPGDEVLLPRPSYPLFGYLAGLNDLGTVFYSLRQESDGWRIDLDELKARIGPRTRAVVLVHPNNPTGSGVTAAELSEISALCARHEAALIADEGFAEYLDPPTGSFPKTLLGTGCLTFALGGLSKWMGLPQMKLSWIACSGPDKTVRASLERLEVIADTALSVNTPVQAAFPRWAGAAAGLQRQIQERVRSNRLRLRTALKDPAKLLPSDGGWNAVLRIPWAQPEEEWGLRLLERRKVLIHPGYFYDFDAEGFAVVGLLTPPDRFEEGIRRILERDA